MSVVSHLNTAVQLWVPLVTQQHTYHWHKTHGIITGQHQTVVTKEGYNRSAPCTCQSCSGPVNIKHSCVVHGTSFWHNHHGAHYCRERNRRFVHATQVSLNAFSADFAVCSANRSILLMCGLYMSTSLCCWCCTVTESGRWVTYTLFPFTVQFQ